MCRNKATGLDDAVKRPTIHHQVFDDGEGVGTPRLNRDVVAILEFAHMELAGGGGELTAMCQPVNHHATRTTNPFPTIMIESDWFFTFRNQLLVQDIKHFQEGHVG